MHPTTYPSLSRLKQISVAVALTCLLPVGAHAVALGRLTVLSAIGQPLRAEIELQSVGEQEKQGTTIGLAPPQAFSRANVEFNPALDAMRFAIETRGSSQVVRITSDGAFNEPFVDVLLELSGANTPRAVREYSFLLDAPRASQTTAAPQVAATDAAVSQPVVAPTQAASGHEAKSEAKPETKPEAKKPEANTAGRTAGEALKPASKPAPKTAGKSEYKIRSGDSLS